MTIHQTTSKRHFFHVPTALHPLTGKYFGIFWSGALISSLGYWIQNVAQGWQVLQLTNSALLLGLVSFIGTIPNLVLLLFGGIIADKFNRRLLVILAESIYMLIALLQGILTTLHIITVWHIILMAFIVGIFNSVGFPAWQAFISDLIQDRELKQGLTLNAMQWNISRVIGPVIGGISIGIFGIAGSYYLNALSYAAVIVPLLLMHPPQKERLKTASQSIKGNLATGLAYVKQRPLVQILLGLQLAVSFFVLPYLTLLPIFAGNIFHTGPTGLGTMNATAGIGALLGTILLLILMARLRRVISTLLGICGLSGLAGILLAWVPNQNFALPLLVTLGATTVMANIVINTFIQSTTPKEIRGRIISILALIIFGVAPFGTLLAGILAQFLGAPLTMAIGGLCCILIASVLVLLGKSLIVSEKAPVGP
jgi:MFS family permease